MELISSHVCMTRDVGNHGNLFGGVMMSWLDSAAYIMAAKKSGNPFMVTKVVTEIDFKSPTKEKEIIEIYGEVSKVGKTSLTIDLIARRVELKTKKKTDKCSLSMVFVQVDSEGNKLPFNEEQLERINE